MDTQVGEQLCALLDPRSKGDKGINGLTFDRVRHTDHGRFVDMGVRDQSRFDLRGTQAMAGDIDHVVEPPHDPVIAVLVTAGPVASIVAAGKFFEIGAMETLRIAVYTSEHARPWSPDDQMAAFIDAGLIAFLGENRGINTG